MRTDHDDCCGAEEHRAQTTQGGDTTDAVSGENGDEILFRRLHAPVASWSVPGIRWAVECWHPEMAYPVGQAWVVVTPYGPFLDWLHVMEGHRRTGVGTVLLTAIRKRWPDLVVAPVTESGESFLAARG